MADPTNEEWAFIEGFPNYQISSHGRVYNVSRYQMMSCSVNNHGLLKISLVDEGGVRRTKSIATLVADAFVPGKDHISDQIILLDGDQMNVHAFNLAWRPRWFAWKYTTQLKQQQPVYYENLAVYDSVLGIEFDNIIEAGTTLGLLFDDIWRSTYSKTHVYPTDSIFEVVPERSLRV